jgi:hypothetical protein
MSHDQYERLHYRLELQDGKFVGCAWAFSESKLITCAHVAADKATAFTARRSFDRSNQAFFRVESTTGTGDWLRDASLLCLLPQSEGQFRHCGEQGIWEPGTGQRFAVFGFPDDKRTMGDFARYEVGQRLPNGWFQVVIEDFRGAELREGYSGAPAWDPVLSCVIGIVVGVDPQRSQKIAYIIPPSTLREQLGEPSIRYPRFGPFYYEKMTSANLNEHDVRRAQRFLSSAVDIIANGVERYWLYACLGTLVPDLRAKEALLQAIHFEKDEFALRGAKQALSKFIS